MVKWISMYTKLCYLCTYMVWGRNMDWMSFCNLYLHEKGPYEDQASQQPNECEIYVKCIVNDLEMWRNPLKIFLWMPIDNIKCSEIVLWLNNTYTVCVNFSDVIVIGETIEFSPRLLVFFITFLDSPTCMSKSLSVLHAFLCIIYTLNFLGFHLLTPWMVTFFLC